MTDSADSTSEPDEPERTGEPAEEGNVLAEADAGGGDAPDGEAPDDDASDDDASGDAFDGDASDGDASDGDASDGDASDGDASDVEPEDLEALRRRVEEEYDFEDFGPAEMAEMEPEEWEAAFDEDTWITGEELLDRVQADLEYRVATRDVFAVVERVTHEGKPCVLAYTDSGYALVEPDGSVEGFGTVLRDAKPVVALCSMESYDVPEAPDADFLLPHPEEVPEGSGELGNRMMQVVAAVHVIAGVALFLAALYVGATSLLGVPAAGPVAGAGGSAAIVTAVVALVFVVVGLALFVTVANARLSDAFRAEEYRERLRTMGLDDGERPEFLPVADRGRELTEEDRGQQ